MSQTCKVPKCKRPGPVCSHHLANRPRALCVTCFSLFRTIDRIRVASFQLNGIRYCSTHKVPGSRPLQPCADPQCERHPNHYYAGSMYCSQHAPDSEYTMCPYVGCQFWVGDKQLCYRHDWQIWFRDDPNDVTESGIEERQREIGKLNETVYDYFDICSYPGCHTIIPGRYDDVGLLRCAQHAIKK